MDTKLRTAWAVAGVLAILLIIMTVMWGREAGVFGGDLAAQRDRVESACRTADDLDSAACRAALTDLAKLLARFERRLERAEEDAEPTVEGTTESTVEVGQ